MSLEIPAFDLESAVERQRLQEEDAIAAGAERFLERLAKAKKQKQEAGAGAAQSMLAQATEDTADVMKVVLENAKTAHGRHIGLDWIEKLGVYPAAYLTVKACMDAMSQEPILRVIAKDLFHLCQDELRYRRFKEQAPNLFKYKVKNFSTSNYAYMSKSMDAAMGGLTDLDKKPINIDVSDLEASIVDQEEIGIKFIDCFLSGSGLLRLENREVVSRAGCRLETHLVPTQETLDFMAKRNSVMEKMYPVNLPMVCPPLRWAPGVRGGYRFALKEKHGVVRASWKANKALETEKMGPVYDALNRIQDTPWKVNTAVLALVEAIWETQGIEGAVRRDSEGNPSEFAGVPPRMNREVPKPDDIADNEKARKAYRKRAGKAKNWNHKRKLSCMDFNRTLGMAKKLKDERAFWFPYTLDFRGRIYPIASYLQPQGDDLQKGLLTFAQGEPLGKDGAAWLALHGANTLGKTPEGQKTSKMPLQSRVDWILQNTPRIIAAAEDPMSNLWWADADEPLQFWAFCNEWAQFWAFHEEGIGHEFVSSLPVAQDGTCNGLQHFSAMALDPIGGREVNLTPGESPRDIYQFVADLVNRQLEIDAVTPPKEKPAATKVKPVRLNKDGTPRKQRSDAGKKKGGKGRETRKVESMPTDFLARLWLRSGLVNRKLTKRPTMTLGYGSKQYGFSDQLVSFMREQDEWEAKYDEMFSVPKVDQPWDTSDGSQPPEEGRRSILQDACQYMAGLCWDALKETVVKAREVMDWMQKCALIVAGSGKQVTWRVPGTGFRVTQGYVEMDELRVRTLLQGQITRRRVKTASLRVDSRKQASAVAPNIVHSLDAAVLMLCVLLAESMGVTRFAFVHDSYGTTAGMAAVLAAATRQAFVGFYKQHDVLHDLYEQFKAQAPEGEEIPLPPEKGTLDLEGVLQSDYFFS